MRTPFSFALLALGVACSGMTEHGAPVASDQDAFIAQLCEAFAPCCGKAGRASDPTECRAFFASQLRTAAYDPARGSQCLTELREAGAIVCAEDFDGPSSCERAFVSRGAKRPGEPCAGDTDCAPSARGDVSCASLPTRNRDELKQCQVQIAGKVGDSPCVGTIDGDTASFGFSGTETNLPLEGYLCDAKQGAFCDETTKLCTAIGTIGATCSGFDTYDCTKDAFCDGSTKKCAPRKVLGTACEGASTQCEHGTFCSRSTGTCTARLAAGAACAASDDCLSDACTDAGTCSGSPFVELVCSK